MFGAGIFAVGMAAMRMIRRTMLFVCRCFRQILFGHLDQFLANHLHPNIIRTGIDRQSITFLRTRTAVFARIMHRFGRYA